MADTITVTPRLVRRNLHYLEIVGVRCGLKGYGESLPCGGQLLVEDWHPKGVRGEWRYEIFCDRCHTCDQNGWPRQDQLLEAITVAIRDGGTVQVHGVTALEFDGDPDYDETEREVT